MPRTRPHNPQRTLAPPRPADPPPSHPPRARAQLAWIGGGYSPRNGAPTVRPPDPDPYRACMVLDGGAHGVIVPYLESPAQVRELRGAVKLRPLKGQRLKNALDGKEELGDELQTYLGKYNRNGVLIVNIESVPALEALDDILAEPGLDAVLVGPHDLSVNLGHPEQYDHPDFQAAVSTIIKKARAASVGAGIHFYTSIANTLTTLPSGRCRKPGFLTTGRREYPPFHKTYREQASGKRTLRPPHTRTIGVTI